MNETVPELSSKRRRFPEEFKQDAVRLVVSEEYSFKAAAAAVGVSEQTLRHWHMPDWRRSRPSAAKTPRWTNCVRRSSGCDANCGGPSWNVKS